MKKLDLDYVRMARKIAEETEEDFHRNMDMYEWRDWKIELQS